MSTGKDKIKGALAATWANAEELAETPGVHSAMSAFSHDSSGDNGTGVVLAVLEAIAARNAAPALAPKVLTDDAAVEEAVRRYGPALYLPGDIRHDMQTTVAFYACYEWLRDNGCLAPAPGLTVEEVIDVVDEWMREPDENGDYFKRDNRRARLTAALTTKASPAKEKPVGAAPLLEFRSKVSSMWYRTPQAAGDVDAVRLFVPGVELPFFYSLDPTAS